MNSNESFWINKIKFLEEEVQAQKEKIESMEQDLEDIRAMLIQIMQGQVRAETRLCKLAIALGQDHVLGKQ